MKVYISDPVTGTDYVERFQKAGGMRYVRAGALPVNGDLGEQKLPAGHGQ